MPKFNNKKCKEKPRKIEPIEMVMIDNFIEVSLPYLVYNANMMKKKTPKARKIHANIHKTREGNSANFLNLCSCCIRLRSKST